MNSCVSKLFGVIVLILSVLGYFFFFNDTATTDIYTLSLHDALPIWGTEQAARPPTAPIRASPCPAPDRKSTRLNSSHTVISYAVFCLKKQKKTNRRAMVQSADPCPTRRDAWSGNA